MDSPASMSSPAPKLPDDARVYVDKDELQGPAQTLEKEELELGLTLGAKTASTGRSRGGGRTCCRILTAKDFHSMASTISNVACGRRGVVAGAKRTASDAASPDGRAPNSSNQMVVGWPPIRAFRMNNLFNLSKDNTNSTTATTTTKVEAATKKTDHHAKNEMTSKNNASSDHDQEKKGKQPAVKKSSGFVKVKMDGDPIGRKVDLSAHQSYESLAVTLEVMFQKPTTELSSSLDVLKASKLLDGSSEFSLTYEDKDGDWMLVGDVPWRMFLDTVKRLRIMRTSDGKGIAPE